MHTAELTFRRRDRKTDREPALEAVNELLHTLRRNGQLVEQDEPIAQVRGGYRVFVSLPEADSLQPRFRTKSVRGAVRALRKAGVTWHATRVLGPDPDSDQVCPCRKPGTLILITDFLSCEPPLRCGDCHGVVPLYRVPPTSEYNNYEDVRFWEYHYRAFDAIWIASGAGERLAYQQLSKPDSELAREGRVLRLLQHPHRQGDGVEVAVLDGHRVDVLGILLGRGVPDDYLLRHWGRSQKAERKRKCPDCGGDWSIDELWLERYDFRCDRCRLVSNIGLDVQ